MSLRKFGLALALAGALGSIGCGGGTGPGEQPAYDACSGNTFFPDGSCQAGECATVDLEKRVFKEWRAQTRALSGLSDAELDDRVKVSTITHSDGPDEVFVRIEYVVVLDWVQSRQADSPQLGNAPLTNAPSDADITTAVKLGIEKAEWAGLGAIDSVKGEAETVGAFEGCEPGMTVDYCEIDFENMTGKLQLRGGKTVDAAQNKCKDAKVDVSSAAINQCSDTPCAIE